MRIAQLTDTHLSLDVPDRIDDLKRCVDQINACHPQPDAAIHTGDIAHNAREDEYETAHSVLSGLEIPWFVMVGNKDERQPVIETFFAGGSPHPEHDFVQYTIDTFDVRLICLDTRCTTSNKGEMCDVRLTDLEQMLDAEPERATVVFMHHPSFSIPVGPEPLQFVDPENAAATTMLLTRYKNICGIICGHVHRTYDTHFDGTPAQVMTAVARDLRFGEEKPIPIDTPLFRLHDIAPVSKLNALA